MIRVVLETADIERLLQGKSVMKHKSLALNVRSYKAGVVIEMLLPRFDATAVQGALNRAIGGEIPVVAPRSKRRVNTLGSRTHA